LQRAERDADGLGDLFAPNGDAVVMISASQAGDE